MLRQGYAGYPLDLRDGVKVNLPAGWFLVRGSNTEPIIRVTAEAANETMAREILAGVYEQVQACINS
jgi:phosphomannomutase